ncbi:50S ribosomal protein L35 [Ferviditalea candida]|uniref:Large ribosomal subunit protein bL35 n=1 Tax=Ferviditalea candida TaxID=3108399 RepID=A0ABU5ZEW1_9BACL|nr:50S ribosomal protein L35 [Paenibacillaceae bacterium T2]
MPKMKTHRGAAKRFSKTGTGKIKRNKAFRRHLLESKDAGRKRHMRGSVVMSASDVKRIRQLLTYVK